MTSSLLPFLSLHWLHCLPSHWVQSDSFGMEGFYLLPPPFPLHSFPTDPGDRPAWNATSCHPVHSFPPGLKSDSSALCGKVVCGKPWGFVVAGDKTASKGKGCREGKWGLVLPALGPSLFTAVGAGCGWVLSLRPGAPVDFKVIPSSTYLTLLP